MSSTSQLDMMLLLFLALLLSPFARAQQTLFPAAIPLAVRSPYLSSWNHITNGTVFGQLWPDTYTPNQILGWAVHVRVDNVTYSLMGDSPIINGTMNLTNIAVSPTRTVVTAQAGPIQANLTFLNPIEPEDWVKQSIPFSYITFAAQSLDGSAHAVQVYTDVSGEWNSGDRGNAIKWNTTTNAGVIYHNVKLQTQAVLNEINNQAQWGNLYYAIKAGTNITYKIDSDVNSRTMFLQRGVLDNGLDSRFRAINSAFPVFAISSDFGTIRATQVSLVWAVGYTVDPAISYADLSGALATQRRLYYKTRYPQTDDEALIVDFLNDYSNALSRARAMDEMILQNATSVSAGGPLGDLVSLAIAQVYGSTQLTIGSDEFGNPNSSDVMMFMKNIGGDSPNRVNAVETLYSAFPAFMFIDPGLGALLLEPLFRVQASSFDGSTRYADGDLGSNYPSVSGVNSTHSKGVEQTGNMLIMTYAHARATGNGSLIYRYYPLLTSWANYLTNSTLFIHDQLSADGLSISNQTNLAIKGIIAIEAMSKMSSVVSRTADAKKYSNVASQLYQQWKSLALSSDQHILAAYQQKNSWTLGYNLFADLWLGTKLVDLSVYDAHSRFIDNTTLMSSFGKFGMPVDNLLSDTTFAISSWNLFVAAMTSDEDLRSNLIKNVHNRASYNVTAGVFPLNYATSDGVANSGQASPAQGAMFAPLALKAPVFTSIKASPIGDNLAPTSPPKTGAIIGGAIGGVAAVLIAIGALVLLRRRRLRGLRRRKSVQSSLSTSFVDRGPSVITPFDSVPLYPTHQGSDSWAERQQLLSESTDTEASPDPHILSSTPAPVLPRLRPVPPVPPGLSDKQLARIRTEALSSQQTDSHESPNSDQLPNPHSNPSSNPSSSQSSSSRSMATERSRARSPTETRRLQSEVELLRREMQQLRTERFEAPPSYTEGDA